MPSHNKALHPTGLSFVGVDRRFDNGQAYKSTYFECLSEKEWQMLRAKVNRFGHVEKLADYQKVFERIA